MLHNKGNLDANSKNHYYYLKIYFKFLRILDYTNLYKIDNKFYKQALIYLLDLDEMAKNTTFYANTQPIIIPDLAYIKIIENLPPNFISLELKIPEHLIPQNQITNQNKIKILQKYKNHEKILNFILIEKMDPTLENSVVDEILKIPELDNFTFLNCKKIDKSRKFIFVLAELLNGPNQCRAENLAKTSEITFTTGEKLKLIPRCIRYIRYRIDHFSKTQNSEKIQAMYRHVVDSEIEIYDPKSATNISLMQILDTLTWKITSQNCQICLAALDDNFERFLSRIVAYNIGQDNLPILTKILGVLESFLKSSSLKLRQHQRMLVNLGPENMTLKIVKARFSTL